MKVKVDIFSGFLGAGKTRLIKKMLEEGYYEEKIAIVENEFGEVSIDGAILKNTEAIVTEINAGCICCQITGDFKSSILNIIDNFEVGRLLIEPTGVAKLSEIKKLLKDKELENKLEIDRCITVVDSERYYKYLKNFRNFFTDQIKSTDIVILSRTQNIESEFLGKLIKDIKSINKNIDVVSKVWGEEKSKDIIPKDLKDNKISFTNYTKFKSGKVIDVHKSNDNNFQTFAININRKVSEHELVSKFKFISSSESFGQVIRAKGIIKVHNDEMKQFDFALDEFSIENVNYNGEGVISFIGLDLNRKEIESFFK